MKYNFKTIIVVFILLILSIISYIYIDNFKIILRSILECKAFCFSIPAVVLIIYFVYYFSSKDKGYNHKPIITESFGDFFDIILGGLGYAIGISSCITLLRGFYIQIMFNEESFAKNFNDLDIWTIFFTIIFLSFFLIKNVLNVAREIFIISSEIEEIN